ncbi:MAG TPA: hypothetical protein H9746_09685 [Candidatus Butyricicoccus avistercoris]|uniref:Uncharacterized protein n=1 Tax=Candidatus Butyricicoccus avistercoris TaxID=2838518 RepID=A0A9D1TIH6_9FIRM|nr:hypothetical protein [Candidatus Butyricicoccus avistercoris]
MYHVANKTKNNYKKLEIYNESVTKLQEKQSNGFIDDKEKALMEATVEEARKKKDAAKRELEKITEPTTTELTPEQRVQQQIKNKYEKKNISDDTEKAEKNDAEIVEEKENNKTRYFTENLSKLDKSKRKLIRQIMGIINQIAPGNIAEEIQAVIEKEFK